MAGSDEVRELIERLPYPVARAAAVAFDEGATPQLRLWNVPHAAYQALRMVTLPVVAQYLDAPVETAAMADQKAVADIAAALAELRHPFYPSWVTLLDTLAKKVTPSTVGIEPLLPLRDVKAALDGAKQTAPDPLYPCPRGDGSHPPHALIWGLRNGLAHGGDLPPDHESLRLLALYLPLVAALLRAVAPLADARLLLLDGPMDGEWTRVRWLRGPTLGGAEAVGDDEGAEEALRGSPVVLSLGRGRAVGLWPLLVATEGQVVGLYDGHYDRKTYDPDGKVRATQHLIYLGAGSERWRESLGFERLVGRLEARRAAWSTPREKAAPWTIAECARYTTGTTVLALRGVKYLPDVHVDRPDLARWVGWWLDGSESPASTPAARRYRNGLILAGAAGSGKTAWSLHLAERLLAEGVPPEAGDAAAREGRNIVLLLRGDQLPERPARREHEGRLLPTVLEHLGLRNQDFKGFGDLFAQLASQWGKDQRRDRRLVVLLDAVNEAPLPVELLTEVGDLVAAAAAVPWCRVAVTMREELLAVVLASGHGQERPPLFASDAWLWSPPEAELRDAGLSQAPSPWTPLRLLTVDEAGLAYERLRTTRGAQACTTPWAHLGATVREELRSPLLLFVHHRAYAGRSAAQATFSEPGDTGLASTNPRHALLGAYLDQIFREFPRLERVCMEVVSRLAEAGRALLSDADARDLAERPDPTGRRVELSPAEQLVHAGLLRRLPAGEGSGFTFVFDSVLEALLHRLWCEQAPGLPLEALQERVRRGIEAGAPEAWWNAFAFVFDDLLRAGRAADWPALINGTSPQALDAAAARAWALAAATCGVASDAPAEALLATPAGLVVAAFGARQEPWAAGRLRDLDAALAHTGRPEWSALLHGAARTILEAVVAAGARELRNDLAMVDNNLGNALRGLGRLDEAVAAYGRARELRAELVEREGRLQVLPDLCMTLYNLLLALSDAQEATRRSVAPSALEQVFRLAVGVRGNVGFERLPRTWLVELADVVGLAARWLDGDAGDTAAQLHGEMRSILG
ncbi:MAG: hypothetical protein AMXMBFR23_28400 [Chloroflexota bacterium]